MSVDIVQEVIHILSQSGLTNKEAQVYTACLVGGELGVGELIKRTGLSRSTIYFITESLEEKGLIRYQEHSGHRIYQAENPRRILAWLERERHLLTKQRDTLQELIPTLQLQYQRAPQSLHTRAYAGQIEVREVLEDILESSRESVVYLFGHLNALVDCVGREYLISWDRQRARQNVELRFLQPPSGTASEQAYTLIYGNRVAHLTTTPEPSAVVLESAPIAVGLLAYLVPADAST